MAKSSAESQEPNRSWVSRFRSSREPALLLGPLLPKNEYLENLLESKQVIERNITKEAAADANSPANALRHTVNALIKLENNAVNSYKDLAYRERKQLLNSLPLEPMYEVEDKILADKLTLIQPLKELETRLKKTTLSTSGEMKFTQLLLQSKHIIEVALPQQEPSPYSVILTSLSGTIDALIKRGKTPALVNRDEETALLLALPTTLKAIHEGTQKIADDANAERGKFNPVDRQLFETLHQSAPYSEDDKRYLTDRFKVILADHKPVMQELRTSDTALKNTRLKDAALALKGLEGIGKSIDSISKSGDFTSYEGILTTRTEAYIDQVKAMSSNHALSDDIKASFKQITREIAHFRKKHGNHLKHGEQHQIETAATDINQSSETIQKAAKTLFEAIEVAYPKIQESYDEVINLFSGAVLRSPVESQISKHFLQPYKKIDTILANLEEIRSELKAIEKPSKKQDIHKLLTSVSAKLKLHEETYNQYLTHPTVLLTDAVSNNPALTPEERGHIRKQSEHLHEDYEKLRRNASINGFAALNPAIRTLRHALATHDPIRQILSHSQPSVSLTSEQKHDLQKHNLRSLVESDKKRVLLKHDAESLHITINTTVGKIREAIEKLGYSAENLASRRQVQASEMEQKYAHEASHSRKDAAQEVQLDRPQATAAATVKQPWTSTVTENGAAALLSEVDSITLYVNRVSSLQKAPVATRLEEHKETAPLRNVPSTSSLADASGTTPDSQLHRATTDTAHLTETQSRSPSRNKEAEATQQPSKPRVPQQRNVSHLINQYSGVSIGL